MPEKAVEVNVVDLDARYELKIFEDEGHNALTKELKKKINKPEHDEDFLLIQINDDPNKIAQIGFDLAEDIKDEMIKCLHGGE